MTIVTPVANFRSACLYSSGPTPTDSGDGIVEAGHESLTGKEQPETGAFSGFVQEAQRVDLRPCTRPRDALRAAPLEFLDDVLRWVPVYLHGR